ncbi:MAG TPA: GDSL-type esterase/lipase family protein [Bryobacteraceae bacterium]|nr:GDSL-type esterase/lipase family protein [Bryobacteraceae bacterium]
MRLLPQKAAAAIAAFLAIAAIPDLVPAFQNYKIVNWSRLGRVAEFTSKATATPLTEEMARLRPGSALTTANLYPLTDAGGALDHFYASLSATQDKKDGSITRILHYGDSPTTADLITADMRSTLQEQFGNAGHGFTLIGKPWAWYSHRGLEIASSGWTVIPASQPAGAASGGLFGLGGVSFRGSPGAYSSIALQDPSHDTVEVAYEYQPGGGIFEVFSAKRLLGQVDTSRRETLAGFSRFSLPPGSSRIDIRVKSGSPLLFGAQFLKSQAGVIYSSLGVNGAYVALLSKMFQEDHWRQQLQHYQPDLVIVNYGTNESAYASFVDQAYTREMMEVIRRIRTAVPQASILVMSPMDRGQRAANGEIATLPVLLRLVTMQQRVALETGCGFFNTFQAMGGPGTMGRWYEAEPRLVSADFIHPMPPGAKLVGNLLYLALMDGYHRHNLRRHPQRIASVADGAITLR